jgi:hypothetical protein
VDHAIEDSETYVVKLGHRPSETSKQYVVCFVARISEEVCTEYTNVKYHMSIKLMQLKCIKAMNRREVFSGPPIAMVLDMHAAEKDASR